MTAPTVQLPAKYTTKKIPLYKKYNGTGISCGTTQIDAKRPL